MPCKGGVGKPTWSEAPGGPEWQEACQELHRGESEEQEEARAEWEKEGSASAVELWGSAGYRTHPSGENG